MALERANREANLFFVQFVELYAKKSWKVLSKILGMIHWKLKNSPIIAYCHFSEISMTKFESILWI
jgi:hypothetical protein